MAATGFATAVKHFRAGLGRRVPERCMGLLEARAGRGQGHEAPWDACHSHVSLLHSQAHGSKPGELHSPGF